MPGDLDNLESLISELNLMLALAIRQKDPAAGVAAIMGKATLLGFVVHCTEIHDMTVQHKPMSLEHVVADEPSKKGNGGKLN